MKYVLSSLLAAALGFALGFAYGYLVEPVEFVDVSPQDLRTDFRTDYILMVAEAFQAEQDLDSATRRLALLGKEPPADLAAQALAFAEQADFSPEELALLEALTQALRTWQASSGATP